MNNLKLADYTNVSDDVLVEYSIILNNDLNYGIWNDKILEDFNPDEIDREVISGMYHDASLVVNN